MTHVYRIANIATMCRLGRQRAVIVDVITQSALQCCRLVVDPTTECGNSEAAET